MRSTFALGLLLATGCYHWQPVTSLGALSDDKVRITTNDDVIVLEHASAYGRIVTGTRPAFLSQQEVDVTQAHVEAWWLNVGAVAGLTTAAVMTVAGIVALVTAALVGQHAHPELPTE